ncbi:MAG: phosphoglycerate dehydrogenase, partial [Candidatus Marinimicrobia bacterium]|nr:phosphoglycerate dehydrogenase [Candidatus Neomarinimicrobiota bacterium]MBT7278676.1 phosphoglycerate dehydrogenase [Candidatus Neomarinimicrobiota bacterium]
MKVLISDPITDAGIAILNDAGFEIVYLPNSEPDEIQDVAKDVHAWIIRSGTNITA